MRITLTNEVGDLHNLEVDQAINVAALKALAEAEFGVPAARLSIMHNGVEITDGNKTIAELHVVNDDILFVKRIPGVNAPGDAGEAAVDPAESLRLQLLEDRQSLTQLANGNPQLAHAALNNPEEFRRLIAVIEQQKREYQHRAAADVAAVDEDPYSLEAQRRIEDAIRQRNVDANMEAAMEHNPESFGRVIMLYVNTEVNGIPVKAFVDSGAQATIMSPECAERCKILHLLDKRFAGVAIGVGQAKILGRVHAATIKVGEQLLMCSFTIMEGKGVDLLFGLDMLKRHQACIDLRHNVLRINEENIAFLAEHELPAQARWEPAAGQGGGVAAASASHAAGAAATARAVGNNSYAAGPQSSTGPSRYPESAIQSLIDLGASRKYAISALDAAGGNPEVAANMFFGMIIMVESKTLLLSYLLCQSTFLRRILEVVEPKIVSDMMNHSQFHSSLVCSYPIAIITFLEPNQTSLMTSALIYSNTGQIY
ncbi:hypothetical protein SeMB42_g04236 [Synchytrium endobioticum]|uniref:DNA damage-inducible protein 1 n=1 Tax=Synchytrium endobioticum TaxID=286115 RepID=A0A507CZW9_9FUNG|nr:hypothetical protein SeLEV6574_g06545 [Synchytrium endobioticum]TPX44724.1 hypothetical protein SeMB42_g04236 [Synchytrium endobioticum]